MNVDHLDCLFQEYGYDVKERTTSYRVYLLNQGMYHGAEIQIMDDDIDATPILDRYSKLGYHAKQQRFKSIEQVKVRKILLVELQISFLQLKKQSIERGHIL